MAARPVRIGSLILVGKPRLTLGTIVKIFPFIAGPKPRDIRLREGSPRTLAIGLVNRVA